MQMSVVERQGIWFLADRVSSIKGPFNLVCMSCTSSFQAPEFVFISILDTAPHQEQALAEKGGL